jgi:4-diphosphocytidyl-2-C-methyl-D-erythritol kinase
MALAFQAPAKINLTLEVLARRDDGYHGIRSVMVPLALCDELTVESSATFSFVCDRPGLGGNDNLVVRAFAALGVLPPLRVSLRKCVPTQAGLGGGSSDAAAVLRAAMAGDVPADAVERRDWPAIARALGSDVPFFLAGTGALVEGTGERVTPLGALPPWHVVIVKPPVAVSTADAYARLDATVRPQRPRADSVSIACLTALQRGAFGEVESLLSNDFHDVIAGSAPEVARSVAALRAAGARNALLAGSGSCVFALFEHGEPARSVVAQLRLPRDYEVFETQFAATPGWRA